VILLAEAATGAADSVTTAATSTPVAGTFTSAESLLVCMSFAVMVLIKMN
jgi:hypothetical protein